MKRHKNAIGIQQGASNALAVANCLAEAIREVRAEGASERTDPACRLIAHQLAFLLNVNALDGPSEYSDALSACEVHAPVPA